MKFLSTGHANILWDQVQARRERKGKGKYMGQDAIEVSGEISTRRLDPKLVPKVPLRFKFKDSGERSVQESPYS